MCGQMGPWTVADCSTVSVIATLHEEHVAANLSARGVG